MKLFLISDNHDTALGFRLAGIEGVTVDDQTQALEAIKSAVKNEDIAILLVTKKAYEYANDFLNTYKLNSPRPLIVEVPDRHILPDDDISRVSDYVKDAIGIKL